MGRMPGPNTTKQDKDGFLSIGEMEMLQALESVLQAVKEESFSTSDYYFKFTTAEVNEQAGSCDRSHRMRASSKSKLSVQMIIAVKSAFQEVENGSLKEGGYYFELTTPHFHLKSGLYPLQEKDGDAGRDDTTELVPWNLGMLEDYVPSVWKYLLSLIKMLLEVEWARPVGSKKKITRLWPRSRFRISIRLILVASVLVVHAGASPIAKEEEPVSVTLEVGTNGIIPFECRNEHQTAPKYYTVTFEGKDRPFCLDGYLDPEGLMSPDQFERFRVVYVENDNEMSIEINIATVSVEDQGTYVVMLIIQGKTPEYRLMKKVVFIFIPPGPAICFLKPSATLVELYEAHCHSKPGNGNSTLSCFQNGEKIPYQQSDAGNSQQIVYRRIFWLMNMDIPVSCCAHDVKKIDSIEQESCNQYRYPRIEPVNSPVSPPNKVPTKTASTTKPLALEEEKKKSFLEHASPSGCSRNFGWPPVVLSIMAFITYGCMSNP